MWSNNSRDIVYCEWTHCCTRCKEARSGSHTKRLNLQWKKSASGGDFHMRALQGEFNCLRRITENFETWLTFGCRCVQDQYSHEKVMLEVQLHNVNYVLVVWLHDLRCIRLLLRVFVLMCVVLLCQFLDAEFHFDKCFLCRWSGLVLVSAFQFIYERNL